MQKERFSIRKTSRGAVSARIALIGFLALAGTGLTVQAEETSPAPVAEVTDEQLETAKAQADQASQAAAAAQAALEAQSQVLAQAQNQATAGQEQVTQAQAAAAAAANQLAASQADQAQASQDLKAAQTATQAAQSAETAAQKALTSKEAEVASKLKDLQAAAAAEAAAATTTVTTTHVHTAHEDIFENDNGTEEKQPMTFAEGRVDVTIKLTPEQAAQVQATGTYDYVPNDAAITQYAVDYINAIKRLNGIPGEMHADEAFIRLAKARADYMYETGVLAHGSNGAIRRIDYVGRDRAYGGENISGLSNVNTYYSGNPTAIMSDQAVAYHLVLRYFNDYNNVRDGYGHALTMLTQTSGMGVGVSTVDVSEFETYGQTVRTGGDGYATMQFSATREEARAMATIHDSFAVVTGEDGRTKLTYQGRDLVFLPRTYFHYVYEQEVAQPASTQARQALAAYQTSSQAALKALADQVTARQADATAAQTKLTEAQTAANTATSQLTQARQAAQAAQARLASTQEAQRDRQASLEAEAAKLAELRQQAQEALTLQAQREEHYADLVRLRDLAAQKAAILARGNLAIPVFNNKGQLIGYTEEAPAQPQPEAPKPEAPKPEAPQPTTPPVTDPQPEAPKPEAPKPTTPPVSDPQPEAPQPEAPKPTTPPVADPQPEAPKPEAPKPTTPPVTDPQPEAPQPEAPKPTTPPVTAPQPEVPKPEAPKPTTPPVADPQPEAPKPEAPKPTTPPVADPQPEAPQPTTPPVTDPQPEAPKPSTPPVTDPQPEAPKPEAPQPTDSVALSQTRNQFLALLDQSGLTDAQKGELAIRATFAESLNELAAVLARFEALTAPVVTPAPAGQTKPVASTSPAPVAAAAAAPVAAPVSKPAGKTLPATGDKASSLAFLGTGLLLASLGAVFQRRKG